MDGKDDYYEGNQIKRIAELLICSQSFEYKTISDARKKVQVGKYFIDYDATTLSTYNSNLNRDQTRQLDLLLMPYYQKLKDEQRESYKELCERRVLLRFLLASPEQYRDAVIEKHTRPDFILTREKRIAIEVTKLTTPFDEEVFTLTNQIQQNQLKQEEEIIEHIQQYHRKIEKKISVVDVSGTQMISSGCHCLDSSRMHFAEEIKNKYIKYKEQINLYDEFIILGDASSGTGLEISEQKEVDETISFLLMICPEIVNVTTVIAWRQTENQKTIIYSWYNVKTQNWKISDRS